MNVQFANAVAAEQAKGLDYDAAFRKVCRSRPDLVKKMHRAPAIGAARDLHRPQLRKEFLNDSADYALGHGLVALVSSDLRDALGILPTDSDAQVKSKIANNVGALNPAQTTALWACVINMIQRTAGSVVAATNRAQALFPKLLSLITS